MRLHRLLLVPVLLAVVACKSGSPPASGPDDQPATQSTPELVPAAEPTVVSTPEPVPEPTPASAPGPEPKSGDHEEVTGLLLNVQRPPDMVPFKAVLDEWAVVDSAGKPIFTHADTPPPESPVGIVWDWKMASALSWTSRKTKLGENFYEIRMTRDEFSEDYKKGTFYVSDATAADLRSMGNLKDLLNRARLVILVGKQGQ